ncbi:hypothetical protein TWF694_007053 [Orbilia ellipsospora]|uniref:Uncharacterized protein n=1 Tax=Orbilia ellipsospora TaxID=2528407 RepID=A0AAV9XME7_9PEZI
MVFNLSNRKSKAMTGNKDNDSFYTYVECEQPNGVSIAFYIWIALAIFSAYMFVLTVAFAWYASLFTLPWIFFLMSFYFREPKLHRTEPYVPIRPRPKLAPQNPERNKEGTSQIVGKNKRKSNGGDEGRQGKEGEDGQGKNDKKESHEADKDEPWYDDSRFDGYCDNYGFDDESYGHRGRGKYSRWEPNPEPRIPNPYLPRNKDAISFIEDAMAAKDRKDWLNDKVGV